MRKPLLLAAIAAGGALVVWSTPLSHLFASDGPERLRAAVESCGAWAPAAYLALNALAVAVGLPRLVFAALGGALFGWAEGSALALTGALAGSWATFETARALGREACERTVLRRFPRARSLVDELTRHAIASNVMIRWIPVGSCFATNLLMSISGMRTRTFLLGTAIGMLPETLVYALFGSAAGGRPALRLALGAVGLLLFTLFVTRWVRRSAPARRILDRTLVEDLEGIPS